MSNRRSRGEQVLHEAASVRQAQMNPLGYLRHAALQLSEEDKELLVYHAFLAATASGELSPQRQSLWHSCRMPSACRKCVFAKSCCAVITGSSSDARSETRVLNWPLAGTSQADKPGENPA